MDWWCTPCEEYIVLFTKYYFGILEQKIRYDPNEGRYFVLQDEVDPPPPVLLRTKHAWCVNCAIYSYTVRACLIVTVHGSIHFVHGSTSSCKTKYLPKRNTTTTDQNTYILFIARATITSSSSLFSSVFLTRPSREPRRRKNYHYEQ